jgi:hypothetical protein
MTASATARSLLGGWVPVVVISAAFAVVAWSGVEQFKSSGGDDEFAYRNYFERLYTTHRLPPKEENYEYALPPGVPALGVAVTWAFAPIVPDRPSPFLQQLPRHVRRVLWVGLVAAGALLIARGPPGRSRRRILGLALLSAAAAWAWSYVNAAVDNERWLPLVLIDYVAAVAFVPLTALLAREVWPHSRTAPALGALGAALLPPIFAASLFFHPDPPFALLAVAATLVAVRAARTGPTLAAGVVTGVLLGAAAWTRQSAPVVAVALLAGIVLGTRRAGVRYALAAALAMLAVAGPWWVHQIDVYGNPVLSNLDRPGYMLDHEPRSFFVSAPGDLIVRPRAYSFENKLLPRFHAYLWSDWGGGYHHWGEEKPGAKVLASVQSVLGFGADGLVLGGVFLIGLPALGRAARGRRGGADPPLTVLTTLFLLSWAAFVATLVRFPQKGGDPIKVHYLLFLAPVSIVFAIAAGAGLVRRGGWTRLAVYGWLAAYSASWVLTLATAF